MHALQAIETKYLPATNMRCSRIVAVTASGMRHVIPYPYDLDPTDAHAKAAEAIARKLHWLHNGESFESRFIAGSTRTGFVFVQMLKLDSIPD